MAKDDDTKTEDLPVPPKVQVSNSPVYVTGKKLGKGGFGQVFHGVRAGRSRTSRGDFKPSEVALKFEHSTSKGCTSSAGHPYEWTVYQNIGSVYGVPKVYYKGKCDDFYVMIMDILGPSLWDVWNATPATNYMQQMDAQYVACIAVEAITILQRLHEIGYVHGDVKPENFLLGQPGTSLANKLYLVDFGLAVRYRDSRSLVHTNYEQRPDDFRGTIRYASIHAHLGRTQSRRDDLESLAYTLIFLLRGRLPWQGFAGNDKAYFVARKKMFTSSTILIGTEHPCFKRFFEAVIHLGFDEEPKYAAYIKCFEPILGRSAVDKPLQIESALAVGAKRGREQLAELNEFLDTTVVSKRMRRGGMFSQWITVYNKCKPMKQRYHYNVSNERLELHVGKGFEDNLMVSSVCCCENLWGIIMDGGTGYRSQVYKVTTRNTHGFLPKDWIMEQWENGYYVTAAAGNSGGGSLVVMSKGNKYTQQSYKISDAFPYEWIKKKWREGFFVTTVATSDFSWAVVMSKGVPYMHQKVELDFQYPSEGIHRLWGAGYRITCCGATKDQAAFILSLPRPGSVLEETQETLRTSTFPSDHVKDKWANDLYIANVAYGRTVS